MKLLFRTLVLLFLLRQWPWPGSRDPVTDLQTKIDSGQIARIRRQAWLSPRPPQEHSYFRFHRKLWFRESIFNSTHLAGKPRAIYLTRYVRQLDSGASGLELGTLIERSPVFIY